MKIIDKDFDRKLTEAEKTDLLIGWIECDETGRDLGNFWEEFAKRNNINIVEKVIEV